MGDIAFYSHNQNCSGCVGTFEVKSEYLHLDIELPVNIQAFLVEAVDSETARDKGTTLIAFTHHLILKEKQRILKGCNRTC